MTVLVDRRCESVAEKRRHFHLADARGNRAFDDAAEAFVVEAFENVRDQARGAGADARAFTRRGLQESPGRARDVDVLHPPGDDGWSEEIVADEGRESLADPVLVARDDRRMRDGKP